MQLKQQRGRKKAKMETGLEKTIQEVSTVIESEYFDLFTLLRDKPFDSSIDICGKTVSLKITNKKMSLGYKRHTVAFDYKGSRLSWYSRGGCESHYTLQAKEEGFFQKKKLIFTIGEWDWGPVRDDFKREYNLPEFLKRCSAKASPKRAFEIAKKISELPKEIAREVEKLTSNKSFEEIITDIKQEAGQFTSSRDYLRLYNSQTETFKALFAKLSEEKKVKVVEDIMANKESSKEIDNWLEQNFKEIVDNAGREHVRRAAG